MSRAFALTASAVVFLFIATLPASAQTRVKAGTLDCNVSGGIGLIIGSQKSMGCVFVSNRGRREFYNGMITRFGLDLGITGRGRLVWAVYAPTAWPPYALAGNYAGGAADASIGVGGGANILVGGNEDTISLQPLSVTGQTGVNIAAGVAGLRLDPVMPERPIRRRYR